MEQSIPNVGPFFFLPPPSSVPVFSTAAVGLGSLSLSLRRTLFDL